MKEQVIQNVYERKLIAIVRGLSAEESFQTAKALCDGGINMIEVTFDQSADDGFAATTEAIRRINQELGERIMAGAGTVLTREQADLACDAGASYIITPGVNADVIRYANSLGLVTMPGAFTPSEIEEAHRAGADFVKVFPAGLLGTDYIKAIKAPLKHIALLAVGGVNENNLKDFLEAGVVGFGIGGNLVNQEWIRNGQFERITKLAEKYVENVRQ